MTSKTNRRAVPGSDATTDTQKEIIRRFGRHDLAYWPSLSKHEINSVVQQFNFANDGLREAIAALDDAYHGCEAEDADRVLAAPQAEEDA